MNKGLGEEKVMGPMYPRPHVNDTEKGGPRAPPRRSTMHMIEDDSANTNNLLPRITKKILARNYLSNSIKSGIPHDARSYIVDVRKGRMRIRMGAALALDVVVLCIGIGWLLCILGSLVG
ncbi:hypothetical protein T459_19533 [Capsicum annuum]|uniref:Uncharacterized protein n=1 Tax=Capsicum annuum TaxID=4072 RepID=A0A2G2Z276_CAPAN|nr:hypothetical protein T459_19533 [Capsicum annuum]